MAARRSDPARQKASRVRICSPLGIISRYLPNCLNIWNCVQLIEGEMRQRNKRAEIVNKYDRGTLQSRKTYGEAECQPG